MKEEEKRDTKKEKKIEITAGRKLEVTDISQNKEKRQTLQSEGKGREREETKRSMENPGRGTRQESVKLATDYKHGYSPTKEELVNGSDSKELQNPGGPENGEGEKLPLSPQHEN